MNIVIAYLGLSNLLRRSRRPLKDCALSDKLEPVTQLNQYLIESLSFVLLPSKPTVS